MVIFISFDCRANPFSPVCKLPIPFLESVDISGESLIVCARHALARAIMPLYDKLSLRNSRVNVPNPVTTQFEFASKQMWTGALLFEGR
jgi:hypothetical protein